MEAIEQGKMTILGYRDVTAELIEGTLEFLRKEDVVRGVYIKSREPSNNWEGEETYKFNSDYQGLQGLVFPRDEIVTLGQKLDIIITKILKETPITVAAQIYHDFSSDERIPVRLSKKKEGSFSFLMFTPFVGYIRHKANKSLFNRLKVGDKVAVKPIHIEKTWETFNVCAKPLKILE